MSTVFLYKLVYPSEAGEKDANGMLDELGEKFEIKKLGKASHILAFGIHQGPGGIFVEQSTYAQNPS